MLLLRDAEKVFSENVVPDKLTILQWKATHPKGFDIWEAQFGFNILKWKDIDLDG